MQPPVALARRSTRRKNVKKNVAEGIAHLQRPSFNNTSSPSDRHANALALGASGAAGFRLEDTTPFAAKLRPAAGRAAQECGVKNLEVA